MSHASDVATARDATTGSGTRASIVIWVTMLVIVAIEVAVTLAHPRMPVLLTTLLLLAVVQATLGLLYFMHLRHERAVLGWSLIAALIFVLGMMNQLWPDAMRLLRLRLHD